MKKAALNLSVEAIIIFVLAFAMLGVGIFVTDQLRLIGSEGIKTSQDILSSIEESPTAEKPIVGIKKSGIDVPFDGQLRIPIGYYNRMRLTAESATIIVDECKSTSTGVTAGMAIDGEYPVNVFASTETVSPSTSVGFLVALNNNNLVGGETYICKLKVVEESDETTTTGAAAEYESLTFFLNVIS